LHADKPEQTENKSIIFKLPWPRLLLGIVVGVVGVLLIVRNVDYSDVRTAFQAARLGYVFLAVVVIIVTILTKTWRWQLIYRSGANVPGFQPLFWALVTGQFFNILVPFRTGEVARILFLEQQAHIIEKTLDIAGLVATILLILPFMTLPEEVSERGNALAIVVIIALPILFLIAFSSRRLQGYSHGIGNRLPAWIRGHFVQILKAGLDGLAALRSKKLTAGLSVVTAAAVILSLLTPLILFKAFSLPFGIREAIIINLLVTVATAPPSTPGRIVVFLAIVRLAMEGFGHDDPSLVLSYAVSFLLVVYAPSLILGGLALAKGKYRIPFKSRLARDITTES
jgi:uncharacterized protein (TIRG00374 family)